MYTANVSECKKALRRVPASVPFTANQLMWMVKDFTKDKRLYVTLDVIEKTLAKMVHAKYPYFFQSEDENGNSIFWKDAAAFAAFEAYNKAK